MSSTGDVRPSTTPSAPIPSKKPIPAAESLPQDSLIVPITADVPRIISGIDLIDYGAGGLYPQQVYVVKGGIGTGKSIVGLQYLSRGLELNEPGILITDQRPETLLAQAKALGFALEDAITRGQLSILNPSHRYFELVESPADVMAIMEELGDYIRKAGARRLVIDPIFTLVTTTYSSQFALSVAQSIVNALEELPVTTLIVAGDEENPEINPIIRALEQNSFGVISLAPDKETGGRVMRLTKLRFSSTDHLAAHYRILNGRGLINYRGEGEQVADITQPWEETSINRNVFVLGADSDTIRRVKEALGDEFTVTAEADFKNGVQRVKKEKPGLVLVTPSRSLQSITSLVELSRSSSSSVAFLSPANNRIADKVLYLRAGADDFITEPFSAAEMKARVEALVRRSGRRLNIRDSSVGRIKPEEIQRLLDSKEPEPARTREAIVLGASKRFDEQIEERIQRNLETVSKLDIELALFWMKAGTKNQDLNRELARLCRQEDILCYNANGEFIAILTGANEHGVRGFEARLTEKLGDLVRDAKRGFALYRPGDPTEGFVPKAFATIR